MGITMFPEDSGEWGNPGRRNEGDGEEQRQLI
jgi:hypothetical protein